MSELKTRDILSREANFNAECVALDRETGLWQDKLKLVQDQIASKKTQREKHLLQVQDEVKVVAERKAKLEAEKLRQNQLQSCVGNLDRQLNEKFQKTETNCKVLQQILEEVKEAKDGIDRREKEFQARKLSFERNLAHHTDELKDLRRDEAAIVQDLDATNKSNQELETMIKEIEALVQNERQKQKSLTHKAQKVSQATTDKDILIQKEEKEWMNEIKELEKRLEDHSLAKKYQEDGTQGIHDKIKCISLDVDKIGAQNSKLKVQLERKQQSLNELLEKQDEVSSELKGVLLDHQTVQEKLQKLNDKEAAVQKVGEAELAKLSEAHQVAQAKLAKNKDALETIEALEKKLLEEKHQWQELKRTLQDKKAKLNGLLEERKLKREERDQLQATNINLETFEAELKELRANESMVAQEIEAVATEKSSCEQDLRDLESQVQQIEQRSAREEAKQLEDQLDELHLECDQVYSEEARLKLKVLEKDDEIEAIKVQMVEDTSRIEEMTATKVAALEEKIDDAKRRFSSQEANRGIGDQNESFHPEQLSDLLTPPSSSTKRHSNRKTY